MYRSDILLHAYHLVRANQGSPGIDGRSFSARENKEGGCEFLAGLEEELREKTYQPSPITWQDGYQNFPSKVLYELCGLYKLPTSAPWKKAHALK